MTAKPGSRQPWENKSWQVVLRNRDKVVADRIADCAYQLSDKTLSGDNKNEAHDALKAKDYNIKSIRRPRQSGSPEFVTLSCLCAGIMELEYSATAPNEKKLREILPEIGFKTITDKKYLQSDKLLKAGDILIKAGDCEIVTSDGLKR